MARLFSIKPSITLKGRKFRGIRGWAGKPTHPPFTDFPIAAYIFAAAFDLISFLAWRADKVAVARESFVAATYVLIAGAAVSLLAAITGFWDWWKGLEREKSGLIGKAKHTQVWRTANFHMVLMLTVTAIVAIDILVRLAQYDAHHAEFPTLVLSAVAALLVSFGSFYGGSLVFDYQFNVESLKGSTAYDETEVDQLPGQKSVPPTTAST